MPAGLAKRYAVRLSNGNLFVEDVFDIDATGATRLSIRTQSRFAHPPNVAPRAPPAS